MRRSKFQAPRVVEDFAAVQRALREVQESLDSISQGRAELRIHLTDFNLKAGNFHRASAPVAGMKARLPKASGGNLGEPVILHLEDMAGTLEVFAAPGDTVNGLSHSDFTDNGVVVLWSNGIDAWSGVAQLPTNSPGGAPLAPIPDQTVLGNDSGADAVASPITVHQELDWIPGAGIGWVFDGINDYIDFGDVNGRERNQPFTWSYWGDTAATTGLTKYGVPAGRGIEFFNQTGVIFQLYMADGTAAADLQVRSTTPPTSGGHHYAVTYDGSSAASGVKLYIDGAPVAMTTVGASVSNSVVTTAPLQIGAENGTAFVAGRMSHVAQWNAVLTDAQVAEVYNGGIPPDLNALPTAPVPVWWVKLDETDAVGAGGVVDHGTGGNNGTAQGGLAPTSGSVGALPVRGSALWQVIPAGTDEFPLVSQGVNTVPAYQRLANAGLATAPANTYKGNNTGGVASVGDVAISDLAGAGMTATGSVLNVIGSTSITVNANDIQRPALTGDVTAPANSNATTIANDAVTNAKAANMAANTVKANPTAGAADPQDVAVAADSVLARVGSNLVSHPWATLAGGGLTYSGGVMAVGAGSFLTVNANDVTLDLTTLVAAIDSTSIASTGTTLVREALTGEVTAATNSNTMTVTRSTNFAASPWTGAHTWNGAVNWTVNVTGDANITATTVGIDSDTTMLVHADNDLTLESDADVNLNCDALRIASTSGPGVAGFIILDAVAASTPALVDEEGMFWVETGGTRESRPKYTGDGNVDHTLVMTGTVTITGANGNLGTVDITSLPCGGTVNIGSSATGAHQIEGFTSAQAYDGYFFHVTSNTSQTTQYLNQDATASANDRIQLAGNVDSAALSFHHAIFTYFTNRWRGVVAATGA
jgi:hypothetical protein